MSFEEDFPSLMEKVETVVESRMGTKLPLSYHKYEVDEDSGEKMFTMEVIRECCVDKAKLRKALSKIENYIPADLRFWFEKEVGL